MSKLHSKFSGGLGCDLALVCWDSVIGPCFFYYVLLSVLSSFACILERERAGCFTLIFFLMSCDCYCYVALPHGAIGCSSSQAKILSVLTFRR